MLFRSNKTLEIKEKVKNYLIKNPIASTLEVAKNLGYDKDFIYKLKEKIHHEASIKIYSHTLKSSLAELEDLTSEVSRILWNIVENKNSKNRDVILSCKTIFEFRSLILDHRIKYNLFAEEKSNDKEKINVPELAKIVREIEERCERKYKEAVLK